MHSKQWDEVGNEFVRFCRTVADLRHPTKGCPWDLEQTHESLRKYMIEEAYEAADVMSPLQSEKLKEELGDVLLQVVLNSQLAEDDRRFNIIEVVAGIDAKMKRRHPHVFSKNAVGSKAKKDEIRHNWEQIKASEKESNASPQTAGVFDEFKKSSVAPALAQSIAIGKTAKKISFDWPDVKAVFAQFKSEVAELEAEIEKSQGSQKNIYDELSDVFFSLGQLCRHLKIDPELCALDGNRKFLSRFALLENLAAKENIDPRMTTSEKLEDLWLKAKQVEKLQICAAELKSN